MSDERTVEELREEALKLTYVNLLGVLEACEDMDVEERHIGALNAVGSVLNGFGTLLIGLNSGTDTPSPLTDFLNKQGKQDG